MKQSAEFAKNARIFNAFFDESRHLDIWIECYALDSYRMFYRLGAYITDLWKIDGEESTRQEILSHMYIERYKMQ